MLNRIHFILISLFVSASSFSENHAVDPRSEHPKSDHGGVGSIFIGKCFECHDGDGKFQEDGIPTAEWKGKVLDSIQNKPGVKFMPPPEGTALTEEEMKQILSWSGSGGAGTNSPTQLKKDICKEEFKVNSAVVRQIFSDRCVACHGKMSFNPTSPLRAGHNQFLNNDGSFDAAWIGDANGIIDYRQTKERDTYSQILSAITSGMMPTHSGLFPVISHPSDRYLPKFGSPHMTDAERRTVVRYLNYKLGRQNCPVSSYWTSDSSPKNFADAARQCQDVKKAIPTIKQLRQLSTILARSYGKGCIWSQSYFDDSSLDGETAQRTVRRTVFSWESGRWVEKGAAETDKCFAACVAE